MKYIFKLIAVTVAALSLAACTDNGNPANGDDEVTLISPSTLTFETDDTSKEITFKSSGEWTAKIVTSVDWMEITPLKGDAGDDNVITVTILKTNDTGSLRSAVVEITSGEAWKDVTVEQKAAGGVDENILPRRIKSIKTTSFSGEETEAEYTDTYEFAYNADGSVSEMIYSEGDDFTVTVTLTYDGNTINVLSEGGSETPDFDIIISKGKASKLTALGIEEVEDGEDIEWRTEDVFVHNRNDQMEQVTHSQYANGERVELEYTLIVWTDGSISRVGGDGPDSSHWTYDWTPSTCENNLNLDLMFAAADVLHFPRIYGYFPVYGARSKYLPASVKYTNNGNVENEKTFTYTVDLEGYITKIVIEENGYMYTSTEIKEFTYED